MPRAGGPSTPAELGTLFLQSSHSLSSCPVSHAFTWTASVQGKSLADTVSSLQTTEPSKARDPSVCSRGLCEREQRTEGQAPAPKHPSDLLRLTVIIAQRPGSGPPSKSPWGPPAPALDRLSILGSQAAQGSHQIGSI